jgi:hypothetical protein
MLRARRPDLRVRMETQREFNDAQLRRFFTVLFTVRAKRHLATLATVYGWSPEALAAHEARFLTPAAMSPRWGPLHRLPPDA